MRVECKQKQVKITAFDTNTNTSLECVEKEKESIIGGLKSLFCAIIPIFNGKKRSQIKPDLNPIFFSATQPQIDSMTSCDAKPNNLHCNKCFCWAFDHFP